MKHELQRRSLNTPRTYPLRRVNLWEFNCIKYYSTRTRKELLLPTVAAVNYIPKKKHQAYSISEPTL